MSSFNANYILFDDDSADQLLPLTFTRPVAELRIGILTIREKWEKYLGCRCSYLTRDYLQTKYPAVAGNKNILVNGSILPARELVNEIITLKENQVLLKDTLLLACNIGAQNPLSFSHNEIDTYVAVQSGSGFTRLDRVWEIFRNNGAEISRDFELLTKGRQSGPISESNKVMNPQNVFLEQGAIMECSIVNAVNGPVYIGREAEVMEGSVIRGALALCDNSVIKVGAKIYGPTTIGPCSKVGGEINNSVITGYSNKAHDGYLGNSVIGEWCNIGADSNVSNMKNNYALVKLWDYQKESFSDTGLQFCGLIMGDHSKCGINTMFNTGTVVGVSANIFGSGFPRNFIPSFSLGGAGGFITFSLSEALKVAEIVMSRCHITLTETDKKILEHVFEKTSKYRRRK
ncbi:MAG TPA: GlmU family protein [Bacteroidales bacterium]|nr:GlmU family protein [Bacteroidales bacterium]